MQKVFIGLKQVLVKGQKQQGHNWMHTKVVMGNKSLEGAQGGL